MTTRPGALCLACSSSPAPKSQSLVPFKTACCSRPICERCLTRNPRLRGYNPCLACLAGVAVVDKSRVRNAGTVPGPSGRQEDDMFVLGDSDEDEPERHEANDREAPPEYTEMPETASTIADEETLVGDAASDVDGDSTDGGSNPPQYYIQRGDTLRGIALKYGVDGRKICELNSLPFSTLSTTPHLLHTRTSLIMPPALRPLLPSPSPDVLEARAREKAEKRFQSVTKEVDWRVAKAYVALAEDEDEFAKTKEDPGIFLDRGKRVLEAKAVDHYLDDGEWEAGQSSGPHIEGFPPFTSGKTHPADNIGLGSRLRRL